MNVKTAESESSKGSEVMRVGAVAAVVASVVLLAGCTSDPDQSGGSLQGKAKLRIAVAATAGLSMEFSGTRSGFAVDIATAVASGLGVGAANIEWVDAGTEPGQLIAAGKADLAIGGRTAAQSQHDHTAFAGPYLNSHVNILVRGDDSTVRDMDALKGIQVCAVKATPAATMVSARFDSGWSAAHLAVADTSDACLKNLLDKKVDAVVGDAPALLKLVLANTGRVRIVPGDGSIGFGIELPASDTKAKKQINAKITTMIGDGSWKKLFTTDLGWTAPYYADAGPTVGAGSP